MSAASFDALVREMKEKSAARDALAKSLASKGGSIRMRHSDKLRALVGPDMSSPTMMFRITYFDSRGPSGHICYGSFLDAVTNALREGFAPE